ncbi:MAG: MFS transporter [Ilumatobacteraceae bacterium]
MTDSSISEDIVQSHGSDLEVLSSPRRWFALIALLGATFVGTVNNNIVNVAIPDIAKDLAVPLTSAVWVVAGFALALATMMPLAGRLGDLYGARRIFLFGVGTFAASSILLALAPNLQLAILGRVLQGVSGAPVLPCVMSTITRIFPKAHRGRAIGLWAAVNSGALAIAPALGGWIVDSIGWRAIFWISGPLILGVGVAVAILVPPDNPRVGGSLDMRGVVLFVSFMISLVASVSLLERLRFSDPLIWLFALVCGLTFVALRRHLSSVREPFIDLRMISNAPFIVNTLIASMQMVVLFGVTLVVPVFLVSGLGRTTSFAGITTATLAGSMLAGSVVSGRLAERVGFPRLALFGGVVILSGTLLVVIRVATTPWLVAGLCLCGLGISLIQTPATVAITFNFAQNETGAAMGIFNMARFIFGGVGATVTAAVLQVGTRRWGIDGTPPLGAFRAALAIPITGTVMIIVLSFAARRLDAK